MPIEKLIGKEYWYNNSVGPYSMIVHTMIANDGSSGHIYLTDYRDYIDFRDWIKKRRRYKK